MLPRADLVGTRPVASPEATRPSILTGDARQEVFQRLNRIALGSFLRGEVLSHLRDGSFMVKVADAAVRMNLPGGTQVGQKLDLTLMATQPRLTFLLGSPPTTDNTASLSNAGRLIDRILHAAKNEGAPQTVAGKSPLVASPNVKPEQLAGAMKNALAFSGLFYESHVGQWASGQRPLMTLMYEPQAKYSNMQLVSAALRAAADASQPGASKPAAAHSDVSEANTAQLAQLFENLKGKPEAARMLMELFRAATPPAEDSLPSASQQPRQATADAPPGVVVRNLVATNLPDDTPAPLPLPSMASADAEAGVRPETMNSDSVRMINLQLNALEQQRVAWQGELWPGQQIEWEITEDTPHGKESAEPEERVWQSTVRFDMPVLGSVAATVRLAGQRVQVQVRTANEDTAALLRMHGEALSSALEAAGSPLDQLAIKSDDVP